jgi:hypothetical protein
MKPGDHPEFFMRPAPDGRSRESTLRLDARGRFWHDGAPVLHAGLAAALHRWIRRHPDNGRYILSNGYDWTYLAVDDAPYFVQRLRTEPERIVLTLSDETEELFDPAATRIGRDDAIYVQVKRAAPDGPYEAKFTPHAQGSFGALLVDADVPSVRIGGNVVRIGRL